jgi:hypothetical protein
MPDPTKADPTKHVETHAEGASARAAGKSGNATRRDVLKAAGAVVAGHLAAGPLVTLRAQTAQAVSPEFFTAE